MRTIRTDYSETNMLKHTLVYTKFLRNILVIVIIDLFVQCK